MQAVKVDQWSLFSVGNFNPTWTAFTSTRICLPNTSQISRLTGHVHRSGAGKCLLPDTYIPTCLQVAEVRASWL